MFVDVDKKLEKSRQILKRNFFASGHERRNKFTPEDFKRNMKIG